MLKLHKARLIECKSITISGSKSESNRLLILKKLFGNIEILNLSNSQDTFLLKEALQSNQNIIDIHHAGTAMRFLTAFFAIQEGREVILTGSKRMKQRPIDYLVTALKDLGADIEYLENKGFPPLKIIGKKIVKNKVCIPANISSQFITSLVLIGGKLENGLQIELLGNITSKPYLDMTLALIPNAKLEGNIIDIPSMKKSYLSNSSHIVESDWSSASYFYSLCAIGKKNIILKKFKKNSFQGDSALVYIYEKFFGVKTIFNNDKSIKLIPIKNFILPPKIVLDMNNYPDIAQTLCVTASSLNIPFMITGLATLKIKETNRLIALQNELKKLGVMTLITEESIESISFQNPEENIIIETYNDHRMAMSFAPYCLISSISIKDKDVVEKSYPNFWEDLNQILTPIN